MGEEFDRNPFLIFKLRGLDRDELMTMLPGEASQGDLPPPDGLETGLIAEHGSESVLPVDPKIFWEGSPLAEEPLITTDAAFGSFMALLRQVGSFLSGMETKRSLLCWNLFTKEYPEPAGSSTPAKRRRISWHNYKKVHLDSCYSK